MSVTETLQPVLSANLILRGMGADDAAILAPLLRHTVLPLHYTFNEPGTKIRDCYFITSGMTSTVAVMKDGSSAEVGVIGPEGLVGFSCLLGDGASPHLTIMQVAGEGLRIDAARLREICDQRLAVRQEVDRFIWLSLAFYAQCAACNRFHTLEQRMSRWLLIVRDRIQQDALPLTHEFLGQMLGAHRSTVTLALGAMERAGVVKNLRARIQLLDIQKLEASSCECLAAIRKLSASTNGNG